ncbi:histidine phosphatase family protein [Bacillus sp. V5-8f]|uniref:histidine phosphatase family protein n=1 Tax=Bacillus sp. V5-8f TaxID=2053044 RepID=UPI0015E126A0|nr:histidine phosphatase family protein [Bacillus sp. V5-8f]
MTTFYLLRHGETEWNSDHNRYCGRTDIGLSSNGTTQAALAAKCLNQIQFSAVYSSPLRRAYETANIINPNGSLQIKSDDRIMEIDFGNWEGQTRDEIERNHPESWKSWLSHPANTNAGESGETANDVYTRAADFFIEKSQQHLGNNVLVVGHNTVNRFYITGAMGLPFNNYRTIKQSNTGITIFEINQSNKIEWLQINSIMHLIAVSEQI